MNERKVIQYSKQMERLEAYDSIREAQEKYHISHISTVCRGQRFTDGGYVWRYAEKRLKDPAGLEYRS